MNQIKNDIGNTIPSYAEGSLWSDDGEVYMLVAVLIGTRDHKYNCISLTNGSCWNNSPTSLKDAVEGLTFLAKSAKITLSLE